MVENKQPATYADVRLFTGDQGSGKSNSMVAFPVGDYHEKMTGLLAPSGQIIKAKCICKEDKIILRKTNISPNKLRYCRVFSDDEKQSKIIKIPENYTVISPVHIFANFTLYGIRYAYITIEDVIENINGDLFDDGWILSDESVMTDPRNSMEATGKLMAQFGGQIRKRHAHFCLAAQYNEMAERRFRLFATTRIECTYDERSKYITLTIKKKGEPEFSTDYWAVNYWPYFKTDEKIKIPQSKIDRTLAKLHETR